MEVRPLGALVTTRHSGHVTLRGVRADLLEEGVEEEEVEEEEEKEEEEEDDDGVCWSMLSRHVPQT